MKSFKKIITFCCVGGIATIIDLIVFNILFKISAWFVFSRILAILVSMIFNFNANRLLTFKALHKRAYTQIWKYLVVYCISMGANVLTGLLVVHALGAGTLSANIAAISGIIVSIPISYIGSSIWVFK
jgi:putative flippase GtrA